MRERQRTPPLEMLTELNSGIPHTCDVDDDGNTSNREKDDLRDVDHEEDAKNDP